MGFLDVVLGRKRLKEASDERLFALLGGDETPTSAAGPAPAGAMAVLPSADATRPAGART